MRAFTVSDQLSARSWHIFIMLSINPMVLAWRTSYFLFLPNLAGLPQKKQSVLKQKPSSYDLSTGLWLLVLGIDSSWMIPLAIWCGLQYFRRHTWCTFSPGTVWILSFLVLLAWLILELPFSVKVENETPVSTGFLQIAHNTGSSMAEIRIKN